MSKGLYSFNDGWYYGRVEGAFIASKEDVSKIMGKSIYLGEICGKHSEVEVEISHENTKLISEDQDLIEKLESLFGSNISGVNPLDNYEEDAGEDEEE